MLGELAEAIFVPEAIRRGFRVCKPFGDNAPFDYVVEFAGSLSRVQIKATAHRHPDGWFRLNAAAYARKRLYTDKDIDFLVAFIFRPATWYIIPVARLSSKGVHVRPANPTGRFDCFRDAWHLLAVPARPEAQTNDE